MRTAEFVRPSLRYSDNLRLSNGHNEWRFLTLNQNRQMSNGIGGLILRKADSSDAETIVRFIRLMVTDMEAMGGHAVASSEESWSQIEGVSHLCYVESNKSGGG